MDFSSKKRIELHSSFNSLRKVPIIKAQVVAYSIEDGQVCLKLLIFKDTQLIANLKKTYAEFKALDEILESKYAKYIKKGYFVKSEMPKKEDFNFNSINSLELFKNSLKSYLEVLTNEPTLKITPINDSTFSSRNLSEKHRESIP